MKRLITILVMLLLVLLSIETHARDTRVIDLNDSTIVAVDNNTIVKAGIEDWAVKATDESITSLSDDEIIRLIETGKVTTRVSFTHYIEKDLFPVLRGERMVELSHWETTNGFLATENEWVTIENGKVNEFGSIALWLGLISTLLLVFLLLYPKNEVERRRETYVSAGLIHVLSLAFIAGLGWLYEVFPSFWTGALTFIGFALLLLIVYIITLCTKDELGLSDNLIVVAGLSALAFFGLVALAVPAKLGFIVLVIPGLLFFSGYLLAEILIIFEPRGSVKLTTMS